MKESDSQLNQQQLTLKSAARDALRSRFFVMLTILFIVEMLVMVIIVLTHVRTGLTIKTHCEVVGRMSPDCTSIDSPWYYIFNFALLPIVMIVANTLISLKLLALKGRQLALCWLWLTLLVGLAVVVLGSVMVINVV